MYDFTLYLVTDTELSLGRELTYIVTEAVKGGVSIVQLREKNLTDRELFQLALELKKVLSAFQIPLLINDRLDIALAVGAAGVHLGQTDIPPQKARELLGNKAIIGISVESLSQVEEANNYDIDYLGISPVFTTPTKTDTVTEWGLDGIKKIRSMTDKKLVAIGGVNISNAADIIRAGADGIAVVSAICSAPNPYQSSQELKDIVSRTKNEGK